MTRRRTHRASPPEPLITALEMLADDEVSVWELCVIVTAAETPGCSQRDVTQRWRAPKSSIARACAALESRDMLRRQPRADQLVSLTLTQTGSALARRLSIPT